jgi:hypothetical protein
MTVPPVGYHTHILIGVEATGSMTVICHWSHVPRQTDLQDQIDKNNKPYAQFLLCTPASVLRHPMRALTERSTGPSARCDHQRCSKRPPKTCRQELCAT